MIIKSLHVNNFRSIENETLQCDDLTMLLGTNGAGKSSFLKALDIFYSTRMMITDNDYYARDTSKNITITVTFKDLTDNEKKLFSKYIENEELVVEKEISWSQDKVVQRYYGKSFLNPDFNGIRTALDNSTPVGELKNIYESVRSKRNYNDLPKWTKKGNVQQTLEEWENKHPSKCTIQRDNGRFFGFKEVGESHLERYTKFLLIPAVRDASEDSNEGKESVLTQIMDLVIRGTLEKREEIRQLQENIKVMYREAIISPNFNQLNELEESINKLFNTYIPDMGIDLNWIEEDFQIPLPKTTVRVIEDGFQVPVECTGHGIQRAFILTMLQKLATLHTMVKEKSSKKSVESIYSSTLEDEITPNIILAIEEPELYQHPNKQRYLARILTELATGKMESVTGRTQVIYCTHSPLFVNMEDFEKLRILRKEAKQPGTPKQTKVYMADLNTVAERLFTAQGHSSNESMDQTPYDSATLRPRLKTLMTPWMNEGFFADAVVLVEGEEDRAAILAVAEILGYDFDGMGIAVIPCNGKNNVDRPSVIFETLGIPVYTVWDNDFSKDKKDPSKKNRYLLNLFSNGKYDSDDVYPEIVESRFACFKECLTKKIESDFGREFYDNTMNEIFQEYSFEKDQGKKNPFVIKELFEKAKRNGKHCEMLEEIVRKIVELKKTNG